MCLACVLLASASTAACAQQKSSFIEFGPATSTPSGWAEFCQRYKDDCGLPVMSMRDIASTDANIALIYRVNKEVNHSIKPLSDFDHWHEIDRWDYAEDGFGDCEDYALVKRRLLLAAGFPQAALLMTVVRDDNMDGHAILTVRTDRGDIVLDNMSDDLHLWWRAPYRYVKMQSQHNPNVWVAVGPNAVRPQISSR
jgi:predicted transglutaminase-like cysteine proteinase